MVDHESEPEPAAPSRVQSLKLRAAELRLLGLERLEAERARRPSARVALDFYERDRNFAGSLLAGGLSVKLFLWSLPFALSIVMTLGAVAEGLSRSPEDLADEAGLGAAIVSMIGDAVANSTRARWYLLVLGVTLLLWAGLGAVRALRLVSRLAWSMASAPRFNALVASLALTGTIMSIMALSWTMHYFQRGPFLVDVIVLAGAVAVLAGILVIAFNGLPRPAGVPWKAVIPGALLTTVGLLVTRLITILYFSAKLTSASDLYGGLGMAAVFLAWLYVISRTLVAAIALNPAVWAKEAGDHGEMATSP